MSSTSADAVNARIDGWSSGTSVTGGITTTAAAPPAGGTGAAQGGWDTSGNRDAAISTINNIRLDLDALKAQVDSLVAVAKANRIIPQ